MTPGPGAKSSEAGEDARVARTRGDVARAALQVLTTEGSDAVTHARVAELAGYSKTTLYTHWPARFDLVAVALDALGELPHHVRSGDMRADLIGELQVFREAVVEMRLDRILAGMAQWASVEEMRQIRDRINTEGQRPLRTMLEEHFEGFELEAVVSMLSGVVACPSIMFGTLPDDDAIGAAVDIVLRSARPPAT
ncbi:MAG: TetR/AcrR family transcriptional regulator [Mycobacterium sp.]